MAVERGGQCESRWIVPGAGDDGDISGRGASVAVRTPGRG